MDITLDNIVKPDKIDRYGPVYSQRAVNDGIVKMINAETYFFRKAQKMNKDYENATGLIEQAQKKLDAAISNLIYSENEITEKTKKISQNIRQSTTKLHEGLVRIEKQANFDRLEKYVDLLERAEKAINSLAELEQSGRLDKIAAAIR